jgi:hypothetical protein
MMQIHEALQIDVSVIDLGDDERLIREGEAGRVRGDQVRQRPRDPARRRGPAGRGPDRDGR